MVRRLMPLMILSLFVLSVASLYANVNAQDMEGNGDWVKFDTGVITVVVPMHNVKPIYFWWYDEEPNKTYVAHYYGLAEVWLPYTMGFRHKYMFHEDGNLSMQILEKLGETPMNKMGKIIKKIGESVRLMHPLFLPFARCSWSFEGPVNITDSSGNVIGVEFSFVLAGKPKSTYFSWNETKGWSFLRNGDIVIRNRVYYVPVNESVDNQTYTVTRAELKNDIVINHWMWNYDILNKSLGNLTQYIPKLKPRLILISRFTVGDYKSSEFNDIADEITSEMGLSMGSDVEIEHGGFKAFTNMSMNREFECDMNRSRFMRHLELIIKSSNSTVAGFYRFIPYATVRYNTTVEEVNVSGVFLLTHRHLTVFLVYPYFNNGSLEHDPSIGVETGTPESPQYMITYENGVPTQVESTQSLNQSGNQVSGIQPSQGWKMIGGWLQSLNAWMLVGVIMVVIIVVLRIALARKS